MRTDVRKTCVLAGTAWLLVVACGPVGEPEPRSGAAPGRATATAEPSLLQRVAVIGASASRGYALQVGLADALSVLCDDARFDVRDCSSSRMFLAPLAVAEKQVECAREAAPTLVVAIDFLFWFGYGFVDGEAQRLERLDQGLTLLEGFECPVVVARLPDMSASIGRMLLSGQVPKRATLERLNVRLVEWARKRGNVTVLPLDRALTELRGTHAAAPEGPDGEALLQEDELHPTAAGELYLARSVLESLVEAGHAIGPLVEPSAARTALEARAAANKERRRSPWE